MPSWSAACWWVCPSRSTRVRASRAVGGRSLEQRLQAAGELAGRRVGQVVGRVRIWPAAPGSGDRRVSAAGPVVVDDGVAGRPVQPRGRVVHPVQRPGGDAAHHHVLGDVGRQLGVPDAGGDERAQPVEDLRPVRVTALHSGALVVDLRLAHRHPPGLPTILRRTGARWTQTGARLQRAVRPSGGSFVIEVDPRSPGEQTNEEPSDDQPCPARPQRHRPRGGHPPATATCSASSRPSAAPAMSTSPSTTRRSSWSCSRTRAQPRR